MLFYYKVINIGGAKNRREQVWEKNLPPCPCSLIAPPEKY